MIFRRTHVIPRNPRNAGVVCTLQARGVPPGFRKNRIVDAKREIYICIQIYTRYKTRRVDYYYYSRENQSDADPETFNAMVATSLITFSNCLFSQKMNRVYYYMFHKINADSHGK